MNNEAMQQTIETLKLDVNLSRAPLHDISELANNSHQLEYEKGEYIFNDEDESKYFYIVESGCVILSKEYPSGKNFNCLVAIRGMPLNAISCFRPRRRFFSARTAEKSKLIGIPCHVFKQWVLAHPEVVDGILTTIGDMLDGAYTRILGLIDESAEQRILNALILLSSRIGPDLAMTNGEIAELTGVSRETAARVISRLKEAGILSKSRGAIKIISDSPLADLSKNSLFIF